MSETVVLPRNIIGKSSPEPYSLSSREHHCAGEFGLGLKDLTTTLNVFGISANLLFSSHSIFFSFLYLFLLLLYIG